jgi:hypothetical protein
MGQHGAWLSGADTRQGSQFGVFGLDYRSSRARGFGDWPVGSGNQR